MKPRVTLLGQRTEKTKERQRETKRDYRCCQKIPHGLQYMIQVSSFWSPFSPDRKRGATRRSLQRKRTVLQSNPEASHHISMEMRSVGTSFFISGIEVGEGGMGAIPARYSRAFVLFLLVSARAKTYNSEHRSIPMQQASLYTQDPILQ